MSNPGFLEYIKKQKPRLWQSLVSAQTRGLVFIDEENDSITATNRLLLTYPDLHEIINDLVNQWAKQTSTALPILQNETTSDGVVYG